MVHAARATAPPSTRHFLIAGEKILKTELTPSVPTPNAFLIAGVCATFSPAPLRALLIGTPIRLEIDLTHSQQTRKHFLIGTIRPTSTPAPLPTHLLSPITHHRLTSFLFDTNKPHKIIILIENSDENKGEPIFYSIQICPSRLPASLLTNHYSRITPSRLPAFHFLPDSCILLGLCWTWDMCASTWM